MHRLSREQHVVIKQEIEIEEVIIEQEFVPVKVKLEEITVEEEEIQEVKADLLSKSDHKKPKGRLKVAKVTKKVTQVKKNKHPVKKEAQFKQNQHPVKKEVQNKKRKAHPISNEGSKKQKTLPVKKEGPQNIKKSHPVNNEGSKKQKTLPMKKLGPQNIKKSHPVNNEGSKKRKSLPVKKLGPQNIKKEQPNKRNTLKASKIPKPPQKSLPVKQEPPRKTIKLEPKCLKCLTTFINQKCLINHDCLFCGLCFKKFTSSYTVQRHIATVHTPNDMREVFICDFCGNTQMCKKGLKIHMFEAHVKKVKDFECDRCGKKFGMLENLRFHVRNHVITNCGICGKRFSLMWLRKHERNVHGHLRSKFECQKCLKNFSTRKSLKTHMNSIHDKSFLCRFCGKSLGSNSLLVDHLKFHDNPDQFKCEVCEKIFETTPTLRNHMKRHIKTFLKDENEEKAFKCHRERCDYATEFNTNFKRHMRFHESFDEKLKSRSDWVMCDKCPWKVFTSLKSYRNHVNVCHKEDEAIFGM